MNTVVQPEISSSKNAVKSDGEGQKPNLRYAWYVVFVLTGMYMFSFVDRQILSLLVPSIKKDLGVSDTQVGLLQGLSFALFYTFMGIPLGRLVDTCNRRNLVAVCIVVWSVFTSLCSTAKSFFSLFLVRIGVGVGEAGLGPSAYSLISDYFPKERIGAAISVFYFGLFFGTSLALLVGGITVDALARTPILTLPILGTIASWRITFLIVGLPGIIFALLAFTVREPMRRNLLLSADNTPAKTSLTEAFAMMGRRWQSVVGISLGMVFQSSCNYAISFWAPTFFLRVHGWTASQTGKALALILIIAGCSGMYVGGMLSDRWQKKGFADGPIRVALISGIGILLFLAPATLASKASWTLALMTVGMFVVSLPMGTSVAALQLIFPNQVRGQVSALFLFILNLGGQTLGPLLPGVFNDYLFHNEGMIGTSLAITIGGSSVVMLLIFLATLRPYRIHYGMMEEARN